MLSLVALLAQTPDLRRTLAAGPQDAVLMAPPQPVCAADVKQMAWTADGGYLIVLRQSAEPSPASGELLVWGRRSGKARTIATFDPRTSTVGEIQPMGGTDRFVVEETDVVREGEAPGTYARVTLVSAASGAILSLGLVRQNMNSPLLGALVSPTQPVGLLEQIDAKAKTWRAFGPDGRLGPEIAVERTDGLMLDSGGFPIQIHHEPEASGKPVGFQSRRIDPIAGRVGAWKPWSPARPMNDEGPITVQSTTIGTLKGVRAPGILLALKDGKADESGVVSRDGTSPLLAPKGEAVAYLDQGLAMVRFLTRVDRKVYDDALRRQAIAEAVQRAKQVGLGLLQYASASNDVLPGQSTDLRSAIGSYLKDDSLLQGFTYTFGGGSEAEIEDVAGTEMGYIPGPGGRAVVYADGHAKWVPDPGTGSTPS